MFAADYTLGEGRCGKVVKRLYNGIPAAVKIVPLEKTDEDHLYRECRIYGKLNHKNVVKLLGLPVKRGDAWHIPLELIEGCNLEELIYGGQLTKADKDLIILGMCEGLNYLHQNDVVHQDLKPNNIMVKHSTKEAVIVDLGLAKFINYTESGSPFSTGSDRGFRQYTAPEARTDRIRSRKSDVWSMGKVIAEVILEQVLTLEFCTAVNVGNILHQSKYANIICQMLHNCPDSRVTMDQVVQHIQSMNYMPEYLRHVPRANTPDQPINWILAVPAVLGFLMIATMMTFAIL